MTTVGFQSFGKKKTNKKTSVFSVCSSFYLLGHGTHRAGDRGQVVTAEVDLCQSGYVADSQGELAKVVVGEIEAPKTRKSRDSE